MTEGVGSELPSQDTQGTSGVFAPGFGHKVWERDSRPVGRVLN
jgi:hypothetical protein